MVLVSVNNVGSFAARAFEVRAAEYVQALFEEQHSIDPQLALPVTRLAWQQLHNLVLAPASAAMGNEPWWLDLRTGTSSDASPYPNATALFYVAPQLPCFAGHFPGQPLLPGVVQLEWATGLANRLWPKQHAATNFVGMARLKFKAPIAPGAVLAMQLGRGGDHSVTLTISSATQTLTSARLLYRD